MNTNKLKADKVLLRVLNQFAYKNDQRPENEMIDLTICLDGQFRLDAIANSTETSLLQLKEFVHLPINKNRATQVGFGFGFSQ